jgi:hypothetical protein
MSVPSASQTVRRIRAVTKNPACIVNLTIDAVNENAKSDGRLSFLLPDEGLESLCSAPPPLEQVTVCSDDDLSSVSSGSLKNYESIHLPLDQQDRQQQPRSIFKKYWDDKGLIPLPIRRVRVSSSGSTMLFRTETAIEEDSASIRDYNTYERTLKAYEEVPSIRRSVGRRSIFDQGCYTASRSTPSFHLRPNHSYNIRKAKSTSILQTRSCLRPSRFSLQKSGSDDSQFQRKQGDKAHSVSFSSSIRIALFEPPAERWAENGWSKWFA